MPPIILDREPHNSFNSHCASLGAPHVPLVGESPHSYVDLLGSWPNGTAKVLDQNAAHGGVRDVFRVYGSQCNGVGLIVQTGHTVS